MIDGIRITPLKPIRDERGAVFSILRSDSPDFERFGEVYCSLVNSGAIKAWKQHKEIAQNLAVPSGKIKLVVYDDRKSSSTRGQIEELYVGEDAYQLVHIPPLLWYGFQGLSPLPALIVNCATQPHDPNEVERLEIKNNLIPYAW